MRDTFLPFALPDTDDSEINAIAEAIHCGWITTGPKARQFEAEFAAHVGAKHAIAVNSCTAAMHLALEAAGLRHGDLVLTTPYTFAATAEVIRYFNATPVFVDVEPDTLNIDPVQLRQAVATLIGEHQSLTATGRVNGGRRPAIGGRLKAIIPVHLAGLPVELDAIYDLAGQYNLAVIEDAAHAFPAKYKGRFIGSALTADHGPQTAVKTTADDRLTTAEGALSAVSGRWSAVCFSFYATKTITTGEGGMICTDDETLAGRCRIMALHGINKDAWKRYTAEGSWYYEIIAPGYKYNMTDIAAAMGLAQLQKAGRMWQRRREIARRYNEAFSCVPELQIPGDRAECRHAWHLYVLRLNVERLNVSRNEFIEQLKVRNIGTSIHFIPLHLHPYYRQTYGYQPDDFPVAFKEFQRVVSLPIYSKMSDEDVADVIRAVWLWCASIGCSKCFRSWGTFGEIALSPGVETPG
ncbi:MAG: DegT/DnrJ/EryC1/StrS family aminotransferase [Chloroflexota bacterium]